MVQMYLRIQCGEYDELHFEHASLKKKKNKYKNEKKISIKI